jgi:hypothetical protein
LRFFFVFLISPHQMSKEALFDVFIHQLFPIPCFYQFFIYIIISFLWRRKKTWSFDHSSITAPQRHIHEIEWIKNRNDERRWRKIQYRKKSCWIFNWPYYVDREIDIVLSRAEWNSNALASSFFTLDIIYFSLSLKE